MLSSGTSGIGLGHSSGGGTIGGPATQTPLALHVDVAHAFVSLHALPGGSYWQVGEQQSPLAAFPSSHCSPSSAVPLPHTAGTAVRRFWSNT